MIPFVLFAALAVGVVALLVAPLVRPPRAPVARAAYDLEVYRDQLAELERGAARGIIGAESRDAARREIERRILALDLGPAAWAAPAAGTRRVVAAAVIAVLVPVAAGALYLAVGAPTLTDRPLAERTAETATIASGTDTGAIEDMVQRLAARLKGEPDDLDGWVLLARSLGALGRYDEAVTALRHVVELTGGATGYVAMLAEHMVFAADGIVTPDALALFDQVAVAVPDDPAARFYHGLAREQAGDGAGALEHWTLLGRASAPEAPWLPSLRARIADAAAALGLDPATVLAGIPEPATATAEPDAPGPTAEDLAAVSDMSAEEQQAMIRGMVERL
ncbi:MAG: c-type cytochrome biogenesis protein CcmI, partial [Alphaproteobacteria bacterium]